MFRKPIPLTGTHKLGGTDQKKLKKMLEKNFGASPEDAELLIPKKSDLQLIKVAAPSRQGLGRVHSFPYQPCAHSVPAHQNGTFPAASVPRRTPESGSGLIVNT